MFHICYHTVITTIATGRVRHYAGKHSTTNLNDGYFGSGKHIRYIKNKIKKSDTPIYDIEVHHSKLFDSSEDAYNFEVLLISELRDKYGRENVLNISDGGVPYNSSSLPHPNLGKPSKNRSEVFNYIDQIKSIWIKNNKPGCRVLRKLCVEQGLPDKSYQRVLDSILGIKEKPHVGPHYKTKEPWCSYDKIKKIWLANNKPTYKALEKIVWTDTYRPSLRSIHCNFIAELNN